MLAIRIMGAFFGAHLWKKGLFCLLIPTLKFQQKNLQKKEEQKILWFDKGVLRGIYNYIGGIGV